MTATITTEEAERIAAHLHKFWGLDGVAVMIRYLAAERDALRAENARLQEALRDLLAPQTPASFAAAMKNARKDLGETQ